MAHSTTRRDLFAAAGATALDLSDRAAIDAMIERLIELLDAIDGDPDMEPEEDCCTAHDDYGTSLRPQHPWYVVSIGSEDDAEDTVPGHGEFFGGNTIPRPEVGTPLTAVFRNPRGETGHFVAVR